MERHSGENPGDSVTGRQRRERRLRGDSHGESPRRVETPSKDNPKETSTRVDIPPETVTGRQGWIRDH